MNKYIYDEKNGLWYEKKDDYYLPCLSLPEEEQKPIGIWGQRHLRYIKEHKRVFYTSLLTSCKLNSYLADINEQAVDLFFSVGNTNGRVRGYYRTSQIGNINLSGLDG